MIDTISQKQLLYEYIRVFHSYGSVPPQFISFIELNNGDSLWRRNNSTGHLTVSALITDRRAERFLLLYHKGLGKWLQPGGHIESRDRTLLSAVMRETEEETGLESGDYDVMSTAKGLYIADLDSHAIPYTPAKEEPEHFHHDVRFLLRLKGDYPHVSTNPLESGGYKWASPDDFPEYFSIEKLAGRLHMYDTVLDICKTKL